MIQKKFAPGETNSKHLRLRRQGGKVKKKSLQRELLYAFVGVGHSCFHQKSEKEHSPPNHRASVVGFQVRKTHGEEDQSEIVESKICRKSRTVLNG